MAYFVFWVDQTTVSPCILQHEIVLIIKLIYGYSIIILGVSSCWIQSVDALIDGTSAYKANL